ncbi:outer membrane protein transport protein [Algirhabdus cladophorae]|uniref:outer membrane protein transport protein n=1 Tax=Algirhabdus cladophorae TaxID=3377108 RepID=UPI003B846016
MNKLLTGAAAIALSTSAAVAGGIERGGNAYSVLYEQGNYAQLGFSTVNPNITGDYPTSLGGGDTDNMAKSYSHLSFAYKNDLSEALSLGFFINQPYGANADYTQGVYQGLAADWKSDQVAAVLRYKVNQNFSVFGGLRYVRSSADIAIPDALIRSGVNDALEADNVRAAVAAGEAQLAQAQAAEAGLQSGNPVIEAATIAALGLPAGTPVAAALAGVQAGIAAATDPAGDLARGQAAIAAVDTGPVGTFDYTAAGDNDGRVSYILGAAYEIPDIALRVSLTYESGYTHEFDTKEFSTGLGIAEGTSGTTEVEMPQSITLDFQSGVAKDTLVFGSIKWAEWSKWEVRTPAYAAATGSAVTGLDNDVYTYRLGVGRKFSDEFSGFARVTYEDAKGGVASRLAPTDGSLAFGIGGTYTMDNIKITGGIEYVKVGDAEDGSGVEFSGSSALGLGLSVGYTF